MNYELVKQLKDAGFPQKSDCSHCQATWDLNTYEPTLEELIEACGYRLDELTQLRHAGHIVWQAVAYSCEECGWEGMHSVRGETPSEAVARLYLALKRKDNA